MSADGATTWLLLLIVLYIICILGAEFGQDAWLKVHDKFLGEGEQDD